MEKPPYVNPGNRSVIGSGLNPNAFPNLNVELGEVTPPGFNKFPSGSKTASFAAGASTPTTADGKAARQFRMK